MNGPLGPDLIPDHVRAGRCGRGTHLRIVDDRGAFVRYEHLDGRPAHLPRSVVSPLASRVDAGLWAQALGYVIVP